VICFLSSYDDGCDYDCDCDYDYDYDYDCDCDHDCDYYDYAYYVWFFHIAQALQADFCTLILPSCDILQTIIGDYVYLKPEDCFSVCACPGSARQ
jgi:hypothetical protein